MVLLKNRKTLTCESRLEKSYMYNSKLSIAFTPIGKNEVGVIL